MTLSAALDEAYAVADVSGDVWDTLEFDHVTFDAPLRFANGTPIKGVFETIDFPIPGGPVPFTVVPFSFQRPSQEEGGPGKAQIRVDNVSRALSEALRGALPADQPIFVTYRAYSTNDPNNPEIYDGLRLSVVNLTALSATGDLYYEEIEMKAFPGLTYDLEKFPALYGQ